MESYFTIEDFHNKAKEILPTPVYDYYSSGARDEYTLRENEEAFKRIKIIPRCLVGNLSKIDLSTTILDDKVSFPILIAATAMHRMAHKDGEIGTYRASNNMGTIYCMSSLSTTTVEEISKSGDGRKWFQLYVAKDRNECLNLIKRVEICGFSALVVTVDTPILGIRYRDIKNRFTLPGNLRIANFTSDDTHLPADVGQSGLERFIKSQIDIDLSWDDIKWISSVTKLPIIVKGILNPHDAIKAIECGVSGIVVSNHGARQLDGVPSTIDMIDPIVKAVKGKVPVFLDGGIRKGTDVFKALALGAKAVFVGRPILWGLSCEGQKGVERALEILRDELKETMILAGCKSLNDIDKSYIYQENIIKLSLESKL